MDSSLPVFFHLSLLLVLQLVETSGQGVIDVCQSAGRSLLSSSIDLRFERALGHLTVIVLLSQEFGFHFTTFLSV